MDDLTHHGTIRALCARHGFALRKGLGQHFLVNPAVCPRLCRVAGIDENTDVLEIGPGFGTLTAQLARRARRVLALEVDARLKPVLGETLAGCGNTRVVFADAMQADLPALLREAFGGSGRLAVCANLPYNITSPLIMRLLEQRVPLQSITVLVQKEAAQRMAALPGTRMAGAISYAVAYYAQASIAFEVSPGSFYPPPKVTSAVLHLDMRANPPLAALPLREARLFKLVRAGFAQRRKTLANAAGAGLGLPKPVIEAALQAAGVPPAARAESLTLENFMALESALWPGGTEAGLEDTYKKRGDEP